jgi:Choline kinase N terminus
VLLTLFGDSRDQVPRMINIIATSMSGKSSFGPEGFDRSEADLIVPSCEAVLNVHTPLAGAENDSSNCMSESTLAKTEVVFKREILEIAQTLKLDGWEEIPLDCSNDIDVQKLSGTSCSGD